MMKMDSTRAQQKKVQHLAVLTFFCCALLVRPAHSASNTVTGTVYGDAATIATATTLSSIEDGASDLLIAHDGTTSLSLNHIIEGSITITNGFSAFTLQATNSTLNSTGSPALILDGGGALNLIGGNFSVSSAPPGDGPPLPPSSGNNIGLLITDTAQTTLTGTTITGGSESGIGGSAVDIENGNLIVTGDSVLTGGEGSSAILATGSDVFITNGTFTGGSGAYALTLASGSSASLFGGTFSSDTGIPTFLLQDSDLSLNGGDVTHGGLLSFASSGKTNAISVHSGLFDTLLFQSETHGYQTFTAGSNFTGNTDLFQVGGTLSVSNISDEAFQIISVSGDASIDFSNHLTLPSDGLIWLQSDLDRANFSDLTISSNATLFAGTSQVSVDFFTAESFSSNVLSITSTTNGFLDTQTAYFKSNAVMTVNLNGAGTSTLETNDFALVSANADQVFAGASTNTAATAETFKENVDVETLSSDRTRFLDLFFETLNGKTFIKFQFTAQSLSDYWGLTNGTSSVVTEEFADELDVLASSEMLSTIDSFGSASASLAAIEETYFTTFNTFQTALQGLQAALGQSVSRGAEFREQLKLIPPGAKGPQRENEVRAWAKYYGQFYNHLAEELNREYDTTLHGGVIGMDKSMNNLLLGISGGAGNYRTTDSIDSEETLNAFHGSLYGTYGTERAYFDAGLAYGFNKVETKTEGAFPLAGEFDAQIISAYFGGGYDLIDTKGGTVFTPEASIQYSLYEQDAYSETSDIAVPRNIDAFDADSLRSSIGLNLSTLDSTTFKTFGFKLDGRFHWLHEFNPEPGDMSFSLEGGTGTYQLAAPLLDEETFRAGFGLTFFNTLRQKPQNVLLRFEFDELFGDGFNSHNLSAKVIYAF